jgi:hypothetical protein
MPELFFHNFWVVALVVNCINVFIMKGKAARMISTNPNLAPGYAQLIRGYFFFGSLPWVVMGIGCTIGGVPTVFSFLRPQDGGPYVLAFWILTLGLYVLGSFWIFFMRGAEFLAAHPGVFRGNIQSPGLIKLLWLMSVVGGGVAMAMIWTQNIPVSIPGQ